MADSDKIVPLKRTGSMSRKKTAGADEPEKREVIYCSFCERPNTEVVKMVKGPGVNICSECTMIAVQYLILEDRLPSKEAQKILDLFWSKTE